MYKTWNRLTKEYFCMMKLSICQIWYKNVYTVHSSELMISVIKKTEKCGLAMFPCACLNCVCPYTQDENN